MRLIALCKLNGLYFLKKLFIALGIPFSLAVLMITMGVTPCPASSDPHSMGMGGARIMYGGGIESAILNPAILGAQLEPWGGARLFPLCNSYAVGYWSDKLALTPYREIFSIDEDGQWQRLVTELIRNSFRVANKSPEETSKRIARQIKKGASIYNTAHVSLLGLTLGTMSFDIRTNVNAQLDVPGAPFLILFSNEQGLQPGNDLSLKHTAAQARVTTDISLGYGRPLNYPELIDFINSFTRGITDFKYMSAGLGLTISLGNGYLDVRTKSGEIRYTDNGGALYMDADMSLKTSGIGLRYDWKFENPFKDGFTLAGLGAGINAGMILYGEHTTLGVTLRQLGPIMWRNIKGSNIKIRTQDLTIVDFFDEDLDIFDPENGGSLPAKNKRLKRWKNEYESLPTRFNIGVGYRFNFRHSDRRAQRALSEYLNTSFEYEQTLAPWPGRSFIPRIALGAENGFLWGVLPLRTGLIFGGAERIASTAGFDLGLRIFRMQFAYKAVGTPFWYPKRGFEVAFGLSTEWKQYRDPDRDGISDKTDKCPHSPEDFDGFEDNDGCEDPDNDGDGIADTIDQCRDIQEDFDSFEDADGCPDYDNDTDSVADTMDQCPMEPEDSDGFNDDDGCPDPDNDEDGVPDTADSCINEKEDFDSILDADGCPEIDADNDAIPDTLDSCPVHAEVYNFINDTDGCPDSVIDFLPDHRLFLDSLSVLLQPSGLNVRGVQLQSAIDNLVRLLKVDNDQKYILYWCSQAESDSIITNKLQTICALLTGAGLDSARIIIPASGQTSLCVQEKHLYGGTLFIKVIESKEEYDSLIKKSDATDIRKSETEELPQTN